MTIRMNAVLPQGADCFLKTADQGDLQNGLFDFRDIPSAIGAGVLCGHFGIADLEPGIARFQILNKLKMPQKPTQFQAGRRVGNSVPSRSKDTNWKSRAPIRPA